MSRSSQRRYEENRAAAHAWNHPPGTPVLVLRANGSILKTVTAGYAFLSDGKHALVPVRGIPGNTSLRRVYLPAFRKAVP